MGSEKSPEPAEEKIDRALLEWLNFELNTDFRSAAEFNDGHKIYHILQKVSRSHFLDDLPAGSITCEKNWRAKFRNLQALGKLLDPFILQNANDYKEWARQDVDYRAIAEHGSSRDMTTLLTKVLVAALNSPTMKQKFIEHYQLLPDETQKILLREVTSGGRSNPQSNNDNLTDLNDDLEHEAMLQQSLAKVVYERQQVKDENVQLKDELDTVRSQFDSLKVERDKLEDQNLDLNDRLARFRSGEDEFASAHHLISKHESQQADIAHLEEELQKLEQNNINLQAQNENLRRKADQAQELQDTIDEMKSRQKDLQRKANVFDKYQEKTMQMRKVENENASLKVKVSELQEEIKKSDMSTASSAGLRREIAEKERLLGQLERDHQDFQQTIKELKVENRKFEMQVTDLEAERLKNEHQIESLEHKLDEQIEGKPLSGQGERLDLGSLRSEPTPRSPKHDYSNLSNDQLREKCVELESRNAELEEGVVTEDELRHLLQAMKERSQQSKADITEEQLKMQSSLATKIGSGRFNSRKLVQQLSDQSAIITELQSRILSPDTPTPQAAATLPPSTETSQPPPPTSSATTTVAELQAAQELNQNLTRELRLMASAWYDLQTRLQSPNASVSRGRAGGGMPDPKSWLGRQRKLVNGALMGR